MSKEKIKETVFDAVLKIQKHITYFLFMLFGILMIYALSGTDPQNDAINSFLPIVTGWLGATIGFYFSREISSIMEDRLKGVKHNMGIQMEDMSNQITVMNSEIEEKNNYIKDLQEEYNKLKTDANATIKEVQDYYERLLKKNDKKNKSRRR